MTRNEHLLIVLMEECAEVQQRVSKALRFGLDEIQPGESYTNRYRIAIEIADLLATMEMIGTDGWIDASTQQNLILDKKSKVEHFLIYSKEQGTLTDGR
jgi:hypothetical protein